MNSRINIFTLSAIMLLTFFLTSCENEEESPDVSNIKVEIKSRSLYKDLYQLDTNDLATGMQSLQKKYPNFLPFYIDTVMGFSINGDYSNDNPGMERGLKTFLSHKDYRGLFDTVIAHYPDTKDVEKDLAKGFQYMKFYYPSYEVPEIIYFTSGLNNYAAFTYGKNTLGIGLDMFLGADYPFYKSVGIQEYFARQLNENYIPVAVFRTIYREKAPFVMQGKVLLDMMIQSGKEMYFVSKVLPFVDEHVRLGYTKEQLEWCEENEAMIYDFFIRQELLYENNMQKVARYVMEGPSATGMPQESPGNIGAWVGLQIVKSYMQKNSNKSLKELTEKSIDAQTFLQKSKYKPK